MLISRWRASYFPLLARVLFSDLSAWHTVCLNATGRQTDRQARAPRPKMHAPCRFPKSWSVARAGRRAQTRKPVAHRRNVITIASEYDKKVVFIPIALWHKRLYLCRR